MDRGLAARLRALPDDDVRLGCLRESFDEILDFGDAARISGTTLTEDPISCPGLSSEVEARCRTSDM